QQHHEHEQPRLHAPLVRDDGGDDGVRRTGSQPGGGRAALRAAVHEHRVDDDGRRRWTRPRLPLHRWRRRRHRRTPPHPPPIPDRATSILSISGTTLTANAGTSSKDCTLAAGPGKHCISEVNTGASCTTDSNCESTAPGSCAPDANCFFGPPLALPNGALST